MSDAPERIWVDGNQDWDSGSWGLDKEFPADVEYVRADRIEALTEQLAAARQDAKEAEAYAEELEANLAKAQAGLHDIAAECGCSIARATLAEIKGGNDAESNL